MNLIVSFSIHITKNALNLETGEMKVDWPDKYGIPFTEYNTVDNPKWRGMR